MPLPSATLSWPILTHPQGSAVTDALAAGRSVLLVGEAGVGKSQLVTDAVARLTAESVADRDLERPPPRTVVSLSGGSRVPGLRLEDVSSAFAALRTASPEGVGPRGTPLVRVEDAHLLGHHDAHALAGMARQGQVQLLATLRSTGASRSPWLELWRDGVAERVDVAPLGAREVEELLTSTLGGPLAAATCERIATRTGGNPFYLRELVRAELEAGTLVERGGIWVGLADAPPGPRVVDMVRHELDALDEPVREALELVALADGMAVGRLAALVREGALDELVREHLVTVGNGEHNRAPVVRVRHPMYGEAVRELVPPGRRRRLYGAVRGTLALSPSRYPGTRAEHVRMALWALESGVDEPLDRLLGAVRAALAMTAWREATQIAGAALDDLAPDDPRRVDTLLMRAAALYQLDRCGEAAWDLAEAGATLAQAGVEAYDPGLRVRLAEQLADLDQFQDDDAARAIERIEAAQEALGQTAPDHVRSLEISRLARLGHAGRFRECLEASLTMLATAPPDATDVLRLVGPVLYGLGQTGRADEADTVAERFLSRVMAQRDPAAPWIREDMTVAHGLALLWAGRPAQVVALLEASPERPLRYSAHEVFAQVGRGMVAITQGRWGEARHLLESAGARYSVRDTSGVGRYVAAVTALASAATGDVAAARRAVERCAALPRRISATLESQVRLLLLDTDIWLASPTCGPDALALAAWSAEQGLHRTELEALHRAVVTDQATVVPDDAGPVVAPLERIGELAPLVLGPRAEALVRHARAVAAGDDDLAQIALTQLGQAGLWLPARGSAPVPLTRREREISSLAAGGLSSKAIAERYTLSVRTVDSHLSRVFTKLGVRSRRELAAALRG